MGAVFHQIDNRNYSATIAVLDKYGELVAHKNFLFLRKHSVDLIVVCADCLEARKLKKSLLEIA